MWVRSQTNPVHDEVHWTRETTLFLKKQFSTSQTFPAVFIDSFYDPKIIVERENFVGNSIKLLKYLQNISEDYQLKDINAVLTEMGRLKSNLSQLKEENAQLNLTIDLESKKKKEMRQLALEHNIKDEEMRFTRVDLIAAAAAGIGFAGRQTIQILNKDKVFCRLQV